MALIRLWSGCTSLVLVMPVLSGCGSDGGGAIMSIPVTPSYPTLASGSGTLNASAALYNYSRGTGAEINATNTSAFSPDVTISYDATSQTYTLAAVTTPGATQPVTAQYGPVQLAAGQGRGNYSATTYVNGVTTVSTLDVGLVALTYSDIAEWRTGGTQASGAQNFNDIYISYGIRTLASDMPKTGTANYTLSLRGASPGAPITGSGALGANFGAGTVNISLSPAYIYAEGNGALGTLTGNGTISSGTSSFTATAAGSGFTANVAGLFYGPQAAEAGGNFIINTSAGGFAAAGALAGKHN